MNQNSAVLNFCDNLYSMCEKHKFPPPLPPPPTKGIFNVDEYFITSSPSKLPQETARLCTQIVCSWSLLCYLVPAGTYIALTMTFSCTWQVIDEPWSARLLSSCNSSMHQICGEGY
jgi:hypothetical protein